MFNVASGATNGVDLLVSAILTHSYWEYGNWGTLVKTGSGKMVLTEANLYQGETTISAGTLLVNNAGSIGVSGFPVTVHAGGHFGGTGMINRNVNVQTGGFLKPGSGDGTPGTLVVNGSLSLAGTTLMELNKSLTPSNDVVVVANALTCGGTLSVTNIGPALALGDSFKVFSKAGGGAFGTIELPLLSAGLGWTNKLAVDGSIAVIQSVSLVPTIIAAQVGDDDLTLSWPLDHTGWRLQAQTNSGSVGIGPNWLDVPGSAGTNRWLVPIDMLNGSVFFRLAYPQGKARQPCK